MTLTVGSLFAGIGGIELGLERAGMETRWQVEINPFASAVLRKHWPDVKRYADVKEVGAHDLEPVDVICGGFPCQDISQAGRGAGIAEGTRSGLWFEFARIVRELRPKYVLVENVAALRSRGLHIVLGDLAACGYDAEWDCIPAAAVGAPHRRDRIWIVAYQPSSSKRPHSDDDRRIYRQAPFIAAEAGIHAFGEPLSVRAHMADSDRQRQTWGGLSEGQGEHRLSDAGGGGRCRTNPAGEGDPRSRLGAGDRSAALADPNVTRLEGRRGDWGNPDQRIVGSGRRPDQGAWCIEPNVGRVAHGVPSRVDRLTALGNAVVPQVAEYIGRLIVADHERQSALDAA